MKTYNVKITGEGTLKEIKQSIENLLEILNYSKEDEYEIEDSTLFSEIKIIE